ncbi:LAFE_0C08702g1_1 [Lachancea fermentati]|uniref:RNA helicase n=1 Tax=Lachancea fermentati TaxID=4955 RepID=A0A1G4M9Z1_LACFM|nr:LAFE_0C08702g1_1 [Lachancea fermentati]
MSNKLLKQRLRQIRNKKPTPSLKNRSNKRISKHTQNTKGKASNLIVSANELKWKPVEIPDTLDDFEGFYGLEEIDGVDVKMENGKVQFVAKDGSKIRSEDDDIASEKMEVEEDNDDSGDEGEDELIEFQNLDDIADGALSAVSDSDEDEENKSENIDNKRESVIGTSSVEAQDADENELQPNVFSNEVDLENFEFSSLTAWTDKMNLSISTLKGLSQLGFTRPTKIQALATPIALEGSDVMGKASTGSGKTLAYGIPILEKLITSNSSTAPVGLIFTPTRELAHQVTQHIQKLSQFALNGKPHAILSLTGGLSIQKQERLLRYEGCARIVIATPGRFLELLERDSNLIERFSRIECLVLDEADRLLQDGHFDEFEKILKHLGNARKEALKNEQGSQNKGWQTMIFSATFSLDLFNKLATTSWKKLGNGKEENEMEMALKHLMTKIHFRSKPVIVDANPNDKVTSKIKESLIECLPTERDLYTYYFITVYPGTTLIFCNAIDSVKKLNAYLNNLDISSFQIHSSMTQKNRLRNLEKFQQEAVKNTTVGKPTVLIASDVAARGLDIPGIQHVVHYHLPRSADVYIHRSGRTARGENEGVSVMICSPQEAMGPLRKLRKVLSSKDDSEKKRKWQKDVPAFPMEPDIISQLRDRSRLASELADDELATRSLSKDDNWLKKAADDLGIELDSDEENRDTFLAKNKTKKINKTLGRDQSKAKRFELQELLKRPIRKDLRKRYLTGGLVNLADNLVKNKGHAAIIGHDKIDALELLKTKKRR